ncbi:MAG: MerR family transcriptional regulator [Sphingobacteriales bacterium]|nr:MerR family transcriptional regulator [Sphingobacteriales bacterium]
MDTKEFIPVATFCYHHNVEISFIMSLQEHGLIDIVNIDENQCIPIKYLVEAEKFVRLHNELEINTEGIDAVYQLLQRINEMQNEISFLKNRLNLYEGEFS